jgi:hypothetical protein
MFGSGQIEMYVCKLGSIQDDFKHFNVQSEKLRLCVWGMKIFPLGLGFESSSSQPSNLPKIIFIE